VYGRLSSVRTRILSRILWSSIMRDARTIIVPYARAREGPASYSIARTLASFIRLVINEVRHGEKLYTKKVMLKIRSGFSVEEAVYTHYILGLMHMPRLLKYLPPHNPPVMLTYSCIGSKKLAPLAGSITISLKRLREGVYKRIEPYPIVVTVSDEPVDPDKVSSLVKKNLREDIVGFLEKALLSIESLRITGRHEYTLELGRVKPGILLIVAPSFMNKEITITFTDGIETHYITIPLKKPLWRLSDFPDKIANEIKTVIVVPLRRGSRYAPRGAIIIGPPGVGKSVLAQAIASELDSRVVSLSPSTYRSMWYGATERILTAIFNRLRNRRDVVIIVDDAEFFTGRHIAVHEVSIAEISILLNALQDPERPFTILTSNAPELIDQALLRPGRIDVVIAVGYPDRTSRRKIVEVLLSKYGLKASRDIVEDIVGKTKWFSHAEIDAFIRLAASHSKEDTLSIEDLEWAYRRFNINYSERRRVHDYLKWYIERLQGLVLEFIASEEEI